MSELVPADSIEEIVGTHRRAYLHMGRVRDGKVFILHSQRCVDSGIDLRTCRFSVAMDAGLEPLCQGAVPDGPVAVDVDRPTGRLVLARSVDWRARLAELARLRDGWYGRRTRGASPQVLEATERVMERVGDVYATEAMVMGLTGGGAIVFEYEDDLCARSLEIDGGDDGLTMYLWAAEVDGDGEWDCGACCLPFDEDAVVRALTTRCLPAQALGGGELAPSLPR